MTRLLVDANGVAVRTWWASPNDCRERFVAAIERVMPSSGVSEVVLCWDSPKNWRRDVFHAYKGDRKPKPQALLEALRECRLAMFRTGSDINREFMPAWNAEVEGYEADDVLATIARQQVWEGNFGEKARLAPTLILSDDKDLLQLVDHERRCFVVDSKGAVCADAGAVTRRLGVPPDRIRHLLSWMGDKSDGLPGVPGYGRKRAIPRALRGEIGYQLTYDLTELVTIPPEQMQRTA